MLFFFGLRPPFLTRYTTFVTNVFTRRDRWARRETSVRDDEGEAVVVVVEEEVGEVEQKQRRRRRRAKQTARASATTVRDDRNTFCVCALFIIFFFFGKFYAGRESIKIIITIRATTIKETDERNIYIVVRTVVP